LEINFILIYYYAFKTGLFYHPNLWYHLEVARNPYNNVFLDRPHLHYFYLSYFSSWLAYFIGATNKISFFLLHLFFSLFFQLHLQFTT